MSFKRCVAHATAASGDVSLPVIPPIVLVSLINWPGAGGIFIDFIPELGTSRGPEAVLSFLSTQTTFTVAVTAVFPLSIFLLFFSVRCVFRHSTGDGVFSGCGRRELEHAFHFSFHDLTVHTPLKSGDCRNTPTTDAGKPGRSAKCTCPWMFAGKTGSGI